MAFPTDPGFRVLIPQSMACCIICRLECTARVLEEHHDTLECAAVELRRWLVEEEDMRKSSMAWRILRHSGLASMYPTRVVEQPKWYVKKYGGERFSREKENWSPRWAVEFVEEMVHHGVADYNKRLAARMLRHAGDNEMFREMAMDDMDWAVSFFEQSTLRSEL